MTRFIPLLALALLCACSKKTEPETEIPAPEAPKISVAEGNKNLPGFALISSSDCMSCHKDNGRFIGPSYAEIAGKYSEADAAYLAEKIIEGGSGVWGQIPMQAHPQISKDEAKQMVEYILSMK